MTPPTTDQPTHLGREMRLAFSLWFLPAIASLSLSASLAAQSPDTLPARSDRLPVSDSALRLPVDRASDLTSWLAGGSLDTYGVGTWRGSRTLYFDRESDGIRWASGLRGRGLTGLGAAAVVVDPELDALDRAHLDVLGGGPATFHFFTKGGGDRWEAHGSGESESPFRADGGMGFSRFAVVIGGPLGAGFRVRASSTLLGREAMWGGIGYGDDPYYVPTAVDTVMRYPDGAALPDSIDAPVLRFGATTKVPFSARSQEGWTVRVDGRLGRATVWGRWIGTRTGERFFNYVDVANPLQARGENSYGSDVAVGLSTGLAGARVDLAVAHQRERSEQGPLTTQGQYDSRDPALGLMLGGLDLRWTMDNFPVDGQLLDNYRRNTPGSRRSPYDLENTAQYALIDQYRNNPYGVLGWSDGGGPVGMLAFSEDHRLLAQGGVTLATGREGGVRLGAELVRHDLKFYNHNLTSQAYSDIWLEKPTEAAFTADWRISGRSWRTVVGARVHHFASGAKRPYLLDTDVASPTYGTYRYFPRLSSYGGGVDSLRRDVEDRTHTAFAPYFVVEATFAERWVAHATLARSARMPDLAAIYGGVNTDLAITNAGQAFGTDLGHEVTDHGEIGATGHWGPFWADASVFTDRFKKALFARFESFYDPATASNRDLVVVRGLPAGSYQGVMLSAGWRAGDRLALQGSYTFTDSTTTELLPGPTGPIGVTGPSGVPRRHSLALTAQANGPDAGPLQGIAALLSFRIASGLAIGYVPGYNPPYPARTEGIPAWSSLDLRVARKLAWGGLDLTVYFDGRNLLNAEDLVAAFSDGAPRSNAAHAQLAWANDSAAYASEALQNSAYNGAGSIDLTFGGAGRGGCGAWTTASGVQNPVNCAYLIGAETRFGNGDGIFSLTEQHAASMAYYRTSFGAAALSGPPRAVRLGLQVGF